MDVGPRQATVSGGPPPRGTDAPSEQAPTRLRLPHAPRRGRGLGRLVLAGTGAFLVAFGLLLRFYAAPRLIAAPSTCTRRTPWWPRTPPTSTRVP